jgi:tRNA A-37 threonylcarbamoyl transferase component Bud32
MPEERLRTQSRLIAGRYQLRRELGRGGMGVVWLADDQLFGRQVAVKELRPPPGLSDADRDIHSQRALQEARSAARIQHPNAVTVHDVLPATAADDAIYLIMELIDGPTLAQIIRRNGWLPDAAVASLGLQLLDVLQAAHSLGIVHRDIKPTNVMVAAGYQVKLTDFGLAHTVGDPRLTRGGTMGTPAYMAPELFNEQPITPAADLWSLGATLYFAAAEGQGPFTRETAEATLHAILIDDVPAPDCSPGLASAISAMLRRDPQRRATIRQARTQLQAATRPAAEDPRTEPPLVEPPPETGEGDEVAADHRARRRRWPIVTTILVVLVIVVGGSYVAWRHTQTQYYVGTDGRQVIIYRGVNQKVLGMSLSGVYFRTGIPLSQVPASDKAAILSATAPGSLTGAQKTVGSIRQTIACNNYDAAYAEWVAAPPTIRKITVRVNNKKEVRTKTMPRPASPTAPRGCVPQGTAG